MFHVRVPRSVEKQLDDISENHRPAILAALKSLKENPWPPGAKKLSGYAEGVFRIRIGTHRILYLVSTAAKTVDIVKIGPRKSTYR